MSVEELISDSTIERFDLRVLSRLSGIDEVQDNATIGAPLEHLTVRKFAAVVEANGRRKTALVDDVVKLMNDSCASKRIIDFNRKAFARLIVDDVHRADPTTVR